MTTVHEQRIQEVVAQLQERRTRAAEVRRKIGEISVSVTAPRKVVKVTVGPRGEVRSVEFPTDGYKRLTPAELAKAFMTAIDQAREKAMAEFAELLAPELPPGLNVPAMIRGEVDFASVVAQDQSVPDEVKAAVDPQAAVRHG